MAVDSSAEAFMKTLKQPISMTDAEIIIAVAELDGWEKSKHDDVWDRFLVHLDSIREWKFRDERYTHEEG